MESFVCSSQCGPNNSRLRLLEDMRENQVCWLCGCVVDSVDHLFSECSTVWQAEQHLQVVGCDPLMCSRETHRLNGVESVGEGKAITGSVL